MRMNARAVLIDPRTLFREALARVLSEARYRFIESVASVADLPHGLPVDSGALLFIVNAGSCPVGENGIDKCGVATLRQQFPDARLAVLGACFGIGDAIAALRAGADGYILDTQTPDALVKSLDLIMLGTMVLPTVVSRALYEVSGTPAPSNTPLGNDVMLGHSVGFSDAQVRVLSRLADGASNKDIARSSDISEATVKIHIRAIFRKINVNSRTQAALWAIKNLSTHSPGVRKAASS